MSMVAGQTLVMAQALLSTTPGEAVRRLQQVAREQVRLFKEAVLQEVIRLSLNSALGPARRRQKPETLIPWSCRRCGPRQADQVLRNGTYERCPLTQEGAVRVRVPQRVCGMPGCRSLPLTLPAPLAPAVGRRGTRAGPRLPGGP